MNTKHILFTGADGNIGRQAIKQLLSDSEFLIDALVMNASDMEFAVKSADIKHTERMNIVTNEEFFSDSYHLSDYDTVIHLAFSRADKSFADIASSLDYESALFRKLQTGHVRRIAYMSSQGIYGKTAEIRTVGMLPAPASIYTMAKYAGEKLLETYYADKPETATAILRLDNVIQSQNLVRALCTSALKTGELHLKGGKQCFSYIDVRDAGGAVTAVVKKQQWEQKIYNVGPDKMRFQLVQIAEIVCKIAEKHGKKIIVSLEKDDTELWAGMDTSVFLKEFSWKPHFSIEMMIEDIYLDIQSNIAKGE